MKFSINASLTAAVLSSFVLTACKFEAVKPTSDNQSLSKSILGAWIEVECVNKQRQVLDYKSDGLVEVRKAEYNDEECKDLVVGSTDAVSVLQYNVEGHKSLAVGKLITSHTFQDQQTTTVTNVEVRKGQLIATVVDQQEYNIITKKAEKANLQKKTTVYVRTKLDVNAGTVSEVASVEASQNQVDIITECENLTADVDQQNQCVEMYQAQLTEETAKKGSVVAGDANSNAPEAATPTAVTADGDAPTAADVTIDKENTDAKLDAAVADADAGNAAVADTNTSSSASPSAEEASSDDEAEIGI